MVLPLSAVLAMDFGVPDVTLKDSFGIAMLVLYVEPVILRQSVQWQSAYNLLDACGEG
jgi:hypothetical protein